MQKILIRINNSILFRIFFYSCYIIGKKAISFSRTLGGIVIFLYKVFVSIFNSRFFIRNLFESVYINGFCSIPVVSLTGLFTGAVLTLQLFTSLSMFGIEDTIPYVVLLSLTKELAPVLCGVMIVARVGSSMSAEIGSMACNSQIDTLTSMSVNKYSFLYIPRILSLVIMQPILTIIAVIAGVIGCFIVSVFMFNFTNTYFFYLINNSFNIEHFIMCVSKASMFGFILSTIACYKGDKTIDGAVGVRRTTISTVVLSCVYILIANFVFTWLFS